MVELVEFIVSRKPAGMSMVEYAKAMDMTDASFYYYKNQQRGNRSGMRVDSLQGIANYFKERDDKEALSILASYALGIDGTFSPS